MRDTILLPATNATGGRVEIIIHRPPTDTPRPALLYMHGHQEESPKPGARWVFDYRPALFETGYVLAAVSMPGYGQTEGSRDFCGPRSQAAVRAGLAHLRSMPEVIPDRIALGGQSRGACISAMVAAEEPSLRALVLAAGIYDFFHPEAFMVDGMEGAFIDEAGASGPDEKTARSAAVHADRIVPPTLFLHGAMDDRAHIDQARAFHKHLVTLGRSSRMVIYPEAKHGLPQGHIRGAVIPYLKEMLE